MHETRIVMTGRTTVHALILAASMLLSGCNVAAWGNLFVLGVTLALFCATLSLGRAAPSSRAIKNQSDSETQMS